MALIVFDWHAVESIKIHNHYFLCLFYTAVKIHPWKVNRRLMKINVANIRTTDIDRSGEYDKGYDGNTKI